MLSHLRTDLNAEADPVKAAFFPSFFKTGPGQYGEGDQFIGVTVPKQRVIAKKYKDLPLADIKKLLDSPTHEERLTALLILVHQFKKDKQGIYDFYLANLDRVNNWDLVDSSAHLIAGPIADIKQLKAWAKSTSLWHRRVAIIATLHHIRNGIYEPTFQIAEMLLDDKEDLIHKAVGWMLREVGKYSGQQVEEQFLQKHYKSMPRTALRYAIERFPDARRKAYLAGTV